MKRIISILISVGFVFSAYAQQDSSCEDGRTRDPYFLSGDIRNLKPLDRPVPIPWGSESEFPWDMIQGSWVIKEQDFESIYTIRVLKDKATKTRKVFIRQYDIDTCAVLSTGQGGVTGKTAWVTMNDQTRTPFYSLSIRSFEESVMTGQYEQAVASKNVNGKVFIFSIQPYANSRYSFHLSADKVSKKVDINCQ